MGERLTRFLTLIVGINNKAALRGIKKLQDTTNKLFNNIAKWAKRGALVVGVALVGAFTLATAEAIKFESAFAGIVKTVDAATDAEGNLTEVGKQLRQEMRDLALEIPQSAASLAGIGEIAGQLGIKAKDITSFTATIAKLAFTTNIAGEEGALNLARFLNITKTATKDVDKLGSVLVELGNNFAAQESQILHVSSNLAALSSALGVSATDILALGTIIEASGGEAQAASSAFQKMGLEMQAAVATGGKDLLKFADAAGVSGKEFARVFREDAFEGLKLFLSGVQKSVAGGESLKIIMDNVGFSSILMTRELAKILPNLDQLSKAQDIANKAFREGSALQKEFEIRLKTTQSQLTLLKNLFTDIGITVGEAILPKLIDKVRTLQEWIKKNRFEIERFAKKAVVVFTDIIDKTTEWIKKNGELLIIIGKIVTVLVAVKVALIAIGVAATAATSPLLAVAAAVLLIGNAIKTGQEAKRGGGFGLNTAVPDDLFGLGTGATSARSGVEGLHDAMRNLIADMSSKKAVMADLQSFFSFEDSVEGKGRKGRKGRDVITDPLGFVQEKFIGFEELEEEQKRALGLMDERSGMFVDAETQRMRILQKLNEDTWGASNAAAQAYYTSVTALSKAYFLGELGNQNILKTVFLQVAAAGTIAVLDSVTEQAKVKAAFYAAEAIGFLNPIAAAKAIAFAAIAGVSSGAAAAIRQRASEQLAFATNNQPPLTPEEQVAGVTRPTGTVGRTGERRGTTVTAPRQTIIISPTTIFNADGDMIFTDGTVEALKSRFEEMVVPLVVEAIEGGRISGG